MKSLAILPALAVPYGMHAGVGVASVAEPAPPMPSVAASLAEIKPSVPATVAAEQFFRAMMEYAEGQEMLLRHVCASYDRLAPDHRWPALSTKALSQALVKHGCRRGQRNTRRTDGKRLTTIQFPEAAC